MPEPPFPSPPGPSPKLLARAEAGWARFLTLEDPDGPDPLLEDEEEVMQGDGPRATCDAAQPLPASGVPADG
ncbi:hypothetical protein OG365_39950 (plasmid) [Streptomyces sp. NBC_00853]|uniref:hypothetical protein n=1 Tax=Streptomyces sp. NBC_00853 TaxID=2903681 RepID=UPI002F90F141|nr:hypothetical protein OG365_39950 [Streptomyces sp. NBC_00853]